MAFTTLSGSDGITSLVGTTGVDAATLVTLNENVFVGGNTGNDTLTTNSGTGSNNLSGFNVRMGGGNDGVVIGDNLLNSFISLDGTTLANDGDDVFNADAAAAGAAGNQIINSQVLGLGGNDTITIANLSNSVVNGNAGNDTIQTAAGVTSSSSSIFGGQGTDTINVAFIGSTNTVNGNRGTDNITVTGTTVAATTLFGGQGADTLTLTNVTIDGNTLSGDLGADNLTGSAAAADILLGGDGNDTLDGNGGGNDTLTGGAGIDAFTVTDNGAATSNASATITDFTGAGAAVNIDTLTVDGAIAAIRGGAVVPTRITQATAAGANIKAALASVTGAGTVGAGGAFATDVIALTYTASGAGNGFAGSYVLIDTDNSGAFTAADTVIAMNDVSTLASVAITA